MLLTAIGLLVLITTLFLILLVVLWLDLKAIRDAEDIPLRAAIKSLDDRERNVRPMPFDRRHP